MNLLWIPLLPLLGTLVPLLSYRFGRTATAALTALLPAISLILVVQAIPAVFAGEALTWQASWIPQIGLNLAFHLDGLALLFSLLILGLAFWLFCMRVITCLITIIWGAFIRI